MCLRPVNQRSEHSLVDTESTENAALVLEATHSEPSCSVARGLVASI